MKYPPIPPGLWVLKWRRINPDDPVRTNVALPMTDWSVSCESPGRHCNRKSETFWISRVWNSQGVDGAVCIHGACRRHEDVVFPFSRPYRDREELMRDAVVAQVMVT